MGNGIFIIFGYLGQYLDGLYAPGGEEEVLIESPLGGAQDIEEGVAKLVGAVAPSVV